ncbi:division plane positioning ATPase MipZ [Paraburkholderia sp. BR10923]|uniref:division plane positioning ATPase MipZ n=1 Tax=Paraburkholderia sp. BR10923 TaxID=3236992 RepID=UPI0034CF805C
MTATITVVGGQKGGTGKSMITGNLAACFARKGAKVGIIDTDYSQNTTDKWHIARSGQPDAARIDCEVRTGRDMDVQLDAWLDEYDHIFVDTNGSDSYELRKALTRANWFITPVKPHPSDNWTLGTIEALLVGAREVNPELRGRVVLSCVTTHPARRDLELKATLAALETFKELRGLLCGTIISDRTAYPDAWGAGRSVTELRVGRDSRSAMDEIDKLYSEIYTS